MAALVWMVVWVGASGRGLGTCGHRHPTSADATLCPFEPAILPDVCAGLVREVRDPEYRAPRERRRARQLELDLGEPAGGAL